VRIEVGAGIHDRATFYHRHLDSSVRKMGRKRASSGARANDAHIKNGVLWHLTSRALQWIIGIADPGNEACFLQNDTAIKTNFDDTPGNAAFPSAYSIFISGTYRATAPDAASQNESRSSRISPVQSRSEILPWSASCVATNAGAPYLAFFARCGKFTTPASKIFKLCSIVARHATGHLNTNSVNSTRVAWQMSASPLHLAGEDKVAASGC
jgi:hypothetical protein